MMLGGSQAGEGRDHVLLYLNGERVFIRLVQPSARLIDVIRERTRFKGVKLACGEGGCGACAVEVLRYDPLTGAVHACTMNACLLPIASMDGCAISTAEGLGNDRKGWHPAQEQIAKHHGSQCGFCTPGIVMACHGVLQRHQESGTAPSLQDFQQGLDGNLCRCTGWRSILDACKGLVDLEDVCGPKSTASCASRGSSCTSSSGTCIALGTTCAAIDANSKGSSGHCSTSSTSTSSTSTSSTSTSSCGSITATNDRFPGWLKQHVCDTAAAATGGPPTLPVPPHNQLQQWLCPRSLQQLLLLMQQHPEARMVAGNTGSGVYKDLWPYDSLVLDLGAVQELQAVEADAAGLTLGAGLSMAKLIGVLRGSAVPSSSKQAFGAIADHVERIAGHHVRSAATLGGHFALLMKRPLQSDLATLLVAAGAELQLTTTHGSHWVDVESYVAGAFTNDVTAKAGTGSATGMPAAKVSLVAAVSGSGRRVAGRARCIADEGSAAGKSASEQQEAPAAAASCPASPKEAHGPSRSQGPSTEPQQVITAVRIPFGTANQLFRSHKMSVRHYNSHALVNIALQLTFADAVISTDGPAAQPAAVTAARIAVGHPSNPRAVKDSWHCGRLPSAEAALAGQPFTCRALLAALEGLWADLTAAGLPDGGYHKQALEGLLFQALAPLLDPAEAMATPQLARMFLDVALPAPPPVVQSSLSWQDNADIAPPLYLPEQKEGVRLQASGQTIYTGDVNVGGKLYAAVVKSSIAHGDLAGVDASPALELPGVVGFVSAADIPAGGLNEARGGPLFAMHEVVYMGQPLGIVVAETRDLAERAAALVAVSYCNVKAPVVTIAQAKECGAFYHEVPKVPMQRIVGNVAAAFAEAKHTIQGGRYEVPSQTHFAMEPQVAVAECLSDGTVRVHSATQSMDGVQRAVARVLNLPLNMINVVAPPLGGAFGAKARAANPIAAAAALAAYKLQAPVQYSLSRGDDLRLNYGRCPAEVVYDVAFEADGRITALDLQVVLRAGAFLDLAYVDLMPLALGFDDAYDFPNLHINLQLARCNLPPHTTMRGPGMMTAVAIYEQVMEHVAVHLNMDSATVREVNMIKSQAPAAPAAPGAATSYSRACTPPPPLNLEVAAQRHCARQDGQYTAAAAAAARAAAATVAAAIVAAAAEAAAAHAGSTAWRSRGLDRVISLDAGMGVVGRPRGGSSGGHAGSAWDSRGAWASMPTSSAAVDTGPGVTNAILGSGGSDSSSSSSSSDSSGSGNGSGSGSSGSDSSSAAFTLPRVWAELKSSSDYEQRRAAVLAFNAEHVWRKRGIAMTPVRFKGKPTPALVTASVYADGSVLVTHGGVEMGQGLSTKVKQAVVWQLSQLLPPELGPLPLSLVRLASSSSDVVPNAGGTWASVASEANCRAAIIACEELVQNLKPLLQAGDTALSSWQATIAAVTPKPGTGPSSVQLSAYGYFDGTNEAGLPVTYEAYVGCVSEVELDVLTGHRAVLRADLLYDSGLSLNPAVDMGQVEGAFVQGLGMMLCEEVVVNEEDGSLISDSTWSLKLPTPDLIPRHFHVKFLEDAPNRTGILSSKATGEPSLMGSASVLLALQQAVSAAAQDLTSAGCQHSAQGQYGLRTPATCGATTTMGPEQLGVQGLVPGQAAPTAGGCAVFVPLHAPATPPHIKAAIGSVRVAQLLRHALGTCPPCLQQ